MLHKNDRMRALSLLSSPLHSYGSWTKQRMEQRRSILLFNQTKNRAALFYVPNAEYNDSILKNWNGTALF
jgi:hypothetical protein